jgi:hypothetical protein
MDKSSIVKQSIHHMPELQRETDAGVASKKEPDIPDNSNRRCQIFMNIFNVPKNTHRRP